MEINASIFTFYYSLYNHSLVSFLPSFRFALMFVWWLSSLKCRFIKVWQNAIQPNIFSYSHALKKYFFCCPSLSDSHRWLSHIPLYYSHVTQHTPWSQCSFFQNLFSLIILKIHKYETTVKFVLFPLNPI